MNLPNVLQAGQSVQNPILWKNVQVALNITAAFIPVLALAFPAVKTLLEQDGALTVLMSFVGTVNGYLTVATTDKVGLTP